MLEVREGRLGRSVHASRPIYPGEIVLTGRSVLSPHQTRHTLQCDHDTHVLVGEPAELINHSCEPNCGIILGREAGPFEVHALRSIARGEELTLDYATLESNIRYMPEICLCGVSECRGRVTGIADLPLERREELGPYVAEYLREAEMPVAASRAG